MAKYVRKLEKVKGARDPTWIFHVRAYIMSMQQQTFLGGESADTNFANIISVVCRHNDVWTYNSLFDVKIYEQELSKMHEI